MKYFNLIVAMLLFAVTFSMAQESRAQRFERIEAEKSAFITKELNLTPSEAQKFFPVYNQYQQEIWKLKQARSGNQRRQNQSNLQSQKLQGNNFNPPQRDVLDFDAKELAVKKNYRKHFADIVGQARASRFFEAEEEFRNYLLRELQQRRRDKDNP